MTYSWAKMPNRWVMSGRLIEFSGKNLDGQSDGQSINAAIAALKTFVAVCTRTEYQSGIAKVTYPELCQLLGMSRALIAKALRILEAHELLRMDSPNRRSGSMIYVRSWLEDRGHAKIPKTWLYQGREPLEKRSSQMRGELLGLSAFKFNTITSLYALKAYIILLAMRSKDKSTKGAKGPKSMQEGNGLTVISYNRIAELTGIPRYKVSACITLLLEMNLISFRPGSYRNQETQDFDRTNRYLIKGLNLRWDALVEKNDEPGDGPSQPAA